MAFQWYTKSSCRGREGASYKIKNINDNNSLDLFEIKDLMKNTTCISLVYAIELVDKLIYQPPNGIFEWRRG